MILLPLCDTLPQGVTQWPTCVIMPLYSIYLYWHARPVHLRRRRLAARQ
eukprot:COSAG04_NODE_19556_length_413_cov_1.031847_1_plen_48_part_01